MAPLHPQSLRAMGGIAALLLVTNLYPVPVYAHMMAITLLIIYAGSFGAIPSDSPQANQVAPEQLQTKDAYMFPVIGSAVLFSLYLAFKFLPKDYINLVIKAYFFVFGIIVLGQRFYVILESLLPSKLVASLTQGKASFVITNPFAKKENKDENSLNVNVLEIFSFILSGIVAYFYVTTNHWCLSNVFGIAFSIQGLEMIGLGSFFNGFILLVGLFFYDIFWVFGTDVMVTVAKSFDAPIKLLFPQATAGLPPSMLGLGDIVIPGIFIALLLRFDLELQKQKRTTTLPYFYTSMVLYFLGLSTTVFVMYYFKHAQPALLYLVPAGLIASFGCALVRGETSALWNFTTEVPAAAEEADKKSQ